MTAELFKQSPWLAAFGREVNESGARSFGSFEQLEKMINEEPDRFFAPPYTSPYEDWCVEDQKAASQLNPQQKSSYDSLCEEAYKAAWTRCPHEEFCALFSDDVGAIYALLILTENNLRPFTKERMEWIANGRVPWGYEGEFPNGQWIVL